MPNTKISQMPAATDFSGSDSLPIVKAGSNRKILASTFFSNIKDPVVINSDSEDNDTVIKGTSDPDLVYVDASTDRLGVGTPTPDEKVHINGNIKITGIEVYTSAQTQTSTGPVDLTHRRIIFDNPSSVTASIAAGKEGQRILLVRKNSGSAVISAGAGATIVGGSTVTLNAIGSSVTLEFTTGTWLIVSAYNITVA